MSVILTGDVHQRIGSSDQHFVQDSEAALAVHYAQIAAGHGVKVTLFVTGRAMIEDGTDAVPLLAMAHVEIGGHGWDALRPRRWHGLLTRLAGSPHGPRWLQRRMIRHTCAIIEQYTGHPVRSWRNHAYRYDRHTPSLLAQAGVRVWSDEVQSERERPYRDPAGIAILPINTLPDHEHLYHGVRTPEFVASEGRGPSYTPEEWCDMVCAQVQAIVEAGGIATVLAHPICMKVADDFATFDSLCAFVSRYPTLLANEGAQRACG